MTLRPCFRTIPEAWNAYIEYSHAAESALRSGLAYEINENLLEWTGPGRWKLTLDPAWAGVFSHREKVNILARLKLAELIRIGFIEFATDASIEDSTRALSHLADFCMGRLLSIHLQDAGSSGKPARKQLAVIGLGKLGGLELNFSSDVDLMFVYEKDPDSDGFSQQEFYNRLCEHLARDLMQETPSGKMYRVDLRLRPEGDSGPLARSLGSCESYYAAYGEIWERLSLLKARGSAGDPGVFYEFRNMQQAFCYSRNLLPEAVAEIPHLKERTEKELVGRENLESHVKLGPGGIRDIEFLVQAHQLLHGARYPILQTGQTLKALQAMAQLDFVGKEEAALLRDAYLFWRRLEHRIQILEHRQTHSLPDGGPALEKIARSLDFSSGAALWVEQLRRRRVVRAAYDAFFDPIRKASPVEHAFTFEFCHEPERARRNWENLGGVQEGFHRGKRTEHAFRRLAPALHGRLHTLVRPDLALAQFTGFVQVYGSRSLLFETLAESPKALEVLLAIFDCSRYLGEALKASPEVFEETARGDLDKPYGVGEYRRDLEPMLSTGDKLGSLRLFKRQQMVRLLIRRILQLASLRELQQEYTALADFSLQFVLEHLGSPRLAIIGLGRHGGQELGFGSDLDILMVGENADSASELAKIMGEQTVRGNLFPVDVRLRPYGEGPLSSPVTRYVEYYRDHAQIWEIQALGKARFAAGDTELAGEFFQQVLPVWRERCKFPGLKDDLLRMRTRIEKERCKSGQPALEFKTGAGGVMDVEFALQYWQMQNGIFEPNSYRALELLEKAHPNEAPILRKGYDFLRLVESWLRIDDNMSLSHLPVDVETRTCLARRFGFEALPGFEARLAEVRLGVRKAFDAIFAG
ncbi:MAG: hypothetical protein PHD76_11805 [Methylacidiphilales bacterium]|nr:hypothetical protein [Candidatus Methylacidiphilales bacterium]